MKIDDSFRMDALFPMQSVRQRKDQRTMSAPTDTQSLSSLANIAAMNTAKTETSVRPLSELKAMLARATSADPLAIADALLSRGFLIQGE